MEYLITPKTTLLQFCKDHDIKNITGDIMDFWNMLKNKYDYILFYDGQVIIAKKEKNIIDNFRIPKNYWIKNKNEINRNFILMIRKLKFDNLNKN